MVVSLGCASERSPDLIQLREIGPRVIEPRSEVDIWGADFPAGRTGLVTFRGTLYTPGQEPRRVELEQRPKAESSGRIPLSLPATLLERWLRGVPHGTFRGEVTVEFAPLRDVGPALLGRLDQVELDLFASNRAGESQAAAAFRRYLGVEIDSRFRVLEVAVGGPGEAAGLAIGDHLLSLDGVNLARTDDFLPAPRKTSSQLRIERSGALDGLILIVEHGNFENPASGSAWPALFCLLGGLVGLLLAAHPPAILRWVSLRRAVGSRRPGAERRAASWGTFPGLFASLGVTLVSTRASWPRAFPSGPTLLLAFGVGMGVLNLALPKDTWVGPVPRPWISRLQRLAFWMPIVVGGAVCGFESGGFGSWQSVSSYGAWPLFASPWLLLLGLGFLVALLGLADLPVRGVRRAGLELQLVILSSFWVATFLAPPMSFPTAVRLVYLGWGTLILDVLVRRAGTFLLGARGSSPLLKLALGLSSLGLLFYSLTFVVGGLRQLPGISEATLTFSIVLLLTTSWAVSRVFTRQARLVDPWV